MNANLLHTLLRHVHVDRDSATDTELLRRYTHENDAEAFTELVQRYSRLVWAVCHQLRPSDAEDAFQATFLVLIRSAKTIHTNALGPWLHTVARRVTMKAILAESRRKSREAHAAQHDRDDAVSPSAWDEMLRAVHEEVAQLPDRLRVPFVLCCLEGKPTTDAAKQLGWKLGTLSGRLSQAKSELLARLERRGLPVASVAAGAFTLGGATLAPAHVVANTLKLIHMRDAIPSTILALTQGAITVSKTKLLAAAVVVTLGFSASLGSWLAVAQTPPSSKSAESMSEAKKTAPVPSPATPTKSELLWEYYYHPLRDETKSGTPAGLKPEEFQNIVQNLETTLGYSYIGQADIVHVTAEGPKSMPTLVFRRPRKAAVDAHGRTALEADVLRSVVADNHRRALAKQVAESKPDKATNGPALDEITAVKKRLNELRAARPLVFNSADYEISDEQFTQLLRELIEKRYGKDADQSPIRCTIESVPRPAGGLPASKFIVTGPVADLRWLAEIMQAVKPKPNGK